MDVGQSTANALYQQAVAGTFKMEKDAAKRCADVFQRFAESLDKQYRISTDLQKLDGFGTFQSAVALQNGFSGKGEELTQALGGMQAAALKMAAAYLRAGDMITEADAMNTLAINASSAGQRG